MAYSVKTVRDAIINNLAAANTTTATRDLSSGLERRIAFIGAGTEQTPVSELPYIVVSGKKKTPAEAYIGPTNRRDVEGVFEIFCATDIMAGNQEAEDEIYRLTDNIEDVLQNCIDLSTTVSVSEVTDTSWSVGDQGATYTHSGIVTLRTMNYGVS